MTSTSNLINVFAQFYSNFYFFSLTVEVNQLRRDKESLSKDLEEIREVAEKRLNNIEELHLDCKRLTEQLAEANAAKCTALVRAEDVEAKEIALKHREARLEQERDLFEERLNALSEDLRQTHDNANETRRDLTTKLAHLEGDLNHKNEFIKNLEGHIEALVADKELLVSKNNDILDRLKDARDSKSTVEEGFRQEVRAQTKLSELYQSKLKSNSGTTLNQNKDKPNILFHNLYIFNIFLYRAS